MNNLLAEHGHPKSRKINMSFRNLEQATNELHEHFKFAHGFVNHMISKTREVETPKEQQMDKKTALLTPDPNIAEDANENNQHEFSLTKVSESDARKQEETTKHIIQEQTDFLYSTYRFSDLSLRDNLLKGDWLSDTDIFNFMKKLKTIFPNVNGLEDPQVIVNRPDLIKKTKDFFRVILSNSNHWVVIAGGVDLISDELYIYDSLYRNKIEPGLGETLVKILSPDILKNDFLSFSIKKSSKQVKTFCGYFALANLTALCFGLDPETLKFNELEIRDHFLKIVYDSEQNLTMFPFELTSKPRTNKILRYNLNKTH